MMNQRLAHVDSSPEPLGLGSGHQPHVDLVLFYTNYVRCINDQTMMTELHKYCHPHVICCGRKLLVEEYRTLMEDSFKAISGLCFQRSRSDRGRRDAANLRQERIQGDPGALLCGIEPK